jgi:hypothetical protein
MKPAKLNQILINCIYSISTPKPSSEFYMFRREEFEVTYMISHVEGL